MYLRLYLVTSSPRLALDTLALSMFGPYITEGPEENPGQQRAPGCAGGVQACIMSVGMRVPYTPLWETHLTEVHCKRAK